MILDSSVSTILLHKDEDAASKYSIICNYSNPQGDAALIAALTEFLNHEYGWNLTADNIALTNGSQNAFFYLFNLFGG